MLGSTTARDDNTLRAVPVTIAAVTTHQLSDHDLGQRVRELVERAGDDVSDRVAFRGAQYDAGLAFVHFPVGLGGLGLARSRQGIVDQTLRERGVEYEDLRINPIGIGMGAPTVLAYGSDDTKRDRLRRIFTGEDIWCQLFSEPTHGSDVAGIQTMAARDGDEWVVNGQTVWTTLAHVARYGMLLVRTNPDVPKHKGLSYFVLDMHAEGVEVRPLYQMTGDAEFNEVFLTDVRIPDRERLGEPGDGWRVAITTLMNERVALSGGPVPRGGGPIATLVETWTGVRDAIPERLRAGYRDRVANLWIRAEVLRLTSQRAKAGALAGNPGPEGSVGKLASAELNKAIAEAVIDLEGPAGTLHEPGYPLARRAGSSWAVPSTRFLRSRASTIEGGTSEIMRNILAERVLGLPPDVRVDTDVAWRDIPRG
jgi:alkylation response protein AidB-like acyl-CoA dehydrogenase